MDGDELLRYFRQMGSTERLAVLPSQLPAFLSGVPTSVDLDILRDGGVFYIKDAINGSGDR